MSRVRRFEDLRVWQTARRLMNLVYDLSERCPDLRLKWQIRDASVSVMRNIAEGFDSFTARQFRHYLSIAKASCGEVRCHLYVAMDRRSFGDADLLRAFRLTDQASRQIWKLAGSIRSRLTREA